MPPTRASQKRQARLTFTPVPSSSPAAQSPSPKRIISNVRYDTPFKSKIRSPLTKSKRIQHDDDKAQEVTDPGADAAQLPTPLKSSQVHETTEIPDDDNLKAATSAPKDDSSHTEGEDDDDIIALRTVRTRKTVDNLNAASDDSEDLPSTRRLHKSPSRGIADDKNRDEQENQRGKCRGSSARLTRSHDTPSSPSKATRRALRSATKPSQSNIAPEQRTTSPIISDLGGAESTSDEDAVLATKPATRRRTQRPRTTKDNFIVDDNTIELVSSDDEAPLPLIQKSNRSERQRARSTSLGGISDTNNTDTVVTPAKRKLSRRSKSSPSKRNKQEELDIEEDLDDLQDSTVQDSRTRGAPVTSARDKYRQGLAALKERRANRGSSPSRPAVQTIDSTDEEDQHYQVPMRTDRMLPIYNDDESSQSDGPEPNEDLDEYEEDFVEQDDALGVPTLPLQFSRWATAPPRDHFRNVVEWLVKNKIAPAFDRSHELFDLSFRKIDDEVKAQAGSRYISSAWKAEFKHALEARPELEIFRIAGEDGEGLWETCAACGRSGHPATWSLSFKGKAYHHSTLEPISDDVSDSEASDDEDAHSHHSLDSASHPLPPSTHSFPLGRHCASNASVAHKLSHWKWHLNTYILALLSSNNLLTPAAIVARDSKSQKKREKEAEAFIDGLDDSGEMERLWKDWKREVEGARRGMEDWGEEGQQGRSGGRRGMGSAIWS